MNLLYPAFLFALSALSIPIIVHLFQFRRIKKVYFSNTRFLRQVNEKTSQQRRLKHYLILAARLLFILFLVLAFAQPYIPASDQLRPDTEVYLYIDNSYSMTRPLADDMDALDAALSIARELVKQLPAATRYKVIDNDFGPSSYTFKNQTEVLDLLSDRKLSPVSRSMQEIVQRIRSEGMRNEKEVFFISDFQQSTLGYLNNTEPDSLERWQLITLQTDAVSNVFIDSVYLENPLAIPGEPNTLHVVVQNIGDKKADAVLVKLIINNMQAAANTISLAATEKQRLSFDLSSEQTRGGPYQAVLSVNDYPLNFDNEFYFILDFTRQIRVLELFETNSPSNVRNVFGNEALFKLERAQPGNFDYNRLNQTDLLVINSISNITPNLALSIQGFTDAGGIALLIPSSQPDLDSYRNLLRMPQLNLLESESMVELERPDFKNPFFEGVFEEESAALVMPKMRRLLHWGTDRNALLKTKDNQPVLSVFSNRGSIYVLASPLNRNYAELQNNALFVPIMYRIAAAGKRNISKLYYLLDETLIDIRLDSLRGEEPLRLIGQQEIIPAQRRVNNRLVMELPPFAVAPGFYQLTQQSQRKAMLALNLSSLESDIRVMDEAEIASRFAALGNVSISSAESVEAFSNEIKARYLGQPLWKYMLILALCFLLCEVLIIRFIK
ncbi:MAG TPA: BatA domain-containing protein [Cyclobacteriaceae bacterium]|nr:BatA domain-containing protein [Cyclobacteriaceae bacterium]